MLDLPEPVLPTMPTFSAPRVWKDTPARSICPLGVLQHKKGEVFGINNHPKLLLYYEAI
jgi:hypothetical protein